MLKLLLLVILSCFSLSFGKGKSRGKHHHNNRKTTTSSPSVNFTSLYCDWGCSTYYDGCNSCFCSDNGLSGCTKIFCTTYKDSYCKTCESNKIWNNCGSPCTKTCDDYDIECAEHCQARCECPENLPIWNGTHCIKLDDCPEDLNLEALTEKYCNHGCDGYYDGCNFCSCTSNSSAICTLKYCFEYEDDYCVCNSNKEYNTCAKECTLTCDDPDQECTTRCVERCACPEDYPIWNGTACIKLEDCSDSTSTTDFYDKYCNHGCKNYFDGCNACGCDLERNTSQCTLEYCEVLEPDYCDECQSNKVWTDCGLSCTPTCDEPDMECIDRCQARCACPEDKPLWNGNECVTENQCDTNEQQTCPDSHCMEWFDGCNTCSCINGTLQACTEMYCTTYEDAYCKTCEPNLEWNECVSCWRTCDDIDIYCPEYCAYKACTCPGENRYYYHGDCYNETQCLNILNPQSVCQCESKGEQKKTTRKSVTCSTFEDESTCISNKCEWNCE